MSRLIFSNSRVMSLSALSPFENAARGVPAQASPRARLCVAMIAAVMTGGLMLPQRVQAADYLDAHALIGAPTDYTTTADDTLVDLAPHFDVGFAALRAANQHVDAWIPGTGVLLHIPTQHLLPNAPHSGIVINLPELRLYYYPPGAASHAAEVQSFPIGIGGEGKETPLGATRVVRKRPHPIWYPTAHERADDPDLPAVVAAGPDNPMGDFAMYLGWSGYAIHGTNIEYSIGRRDSHGCIRLYPEDIARLFAMVPVGTPVLVVDQQVKLGWADGRLYLEVHASQDDADALEADGAPASAPQDIDEQVLASALSVAGQIDWDAVHAAAQRRDGIPVAITPAPGAPAASAP